MANTYKKTCKNITKKVTKFERKHPVLTGTCYIATGISMAASIIAYPINRIRINRALKAMGEQENIDQNAQQSENAANAATDNSNG
jgi:hypothetical protein